MPPHVENVGLAAGEELIVEADGALHIALIDGVVEIAGVMLVPQREYSFHLPAGGGSRVMCYTLDGGTVALRSDSAVKTHRCPTQVHALLNTIRSNLSTIRNGRILVVGPPGCGKSLACRVICNVLSRGNTVVLADADIESNSVCGAAAMGCDLIPGTGINMGECLPTTNPICFFFGDIQISANNVGLFLHWCAQMTECCRWLCSQGPSATSNSFVVIDTPNAPLSVIDHESFCKRLVEATQPNVLLIIGFDESTNEKLQQDISRVHTDCRVLSLPSLCQKPFTGEKPTCWYLERYFVGTPIAPLAVAHVVVTLSMTKMFSISHKSGEVHLTRVEHQKSLVNRVGAVSHAAIEQEVPYANIAGLVVIADISLEHDELTLIIPTGELFLPRQFLIVSESEDAARIPWDLFAQRSV